MAHIRENKKGKLIAEFDSVPEVFQVIKQLGWVPQNGKSSDDRGSGDFHVFENLAAANDVFHNNPESIRQFSIHDEKLVTKDSPGKDVLFDVTGDYVDIDRYLEGIPENFGQAVLGNPKSVFATINILNSAVHWTSPEYMLHKQRRIMRLVDWLEQQDIRCQIVLTEDSEVCYTQIVVKEFGDHFDLNHLAVAMHPDFFRRTMFLIMEQSKTWTWGYGSAIDYDKRMLKYKPNPEDGLYVYVGGYIPFENNNLKKLDEAFDKIEESIQREVVDMERTWVDEQLHVAGDTKGW